MKLDITTITFITGLVFATQTIAYFVQYRVNRTYNGLGWWLLGAILQALGFLLIPTLKIPAIWMLSVLANPLIFAGQIALNIGLGKFLDKKKRIAAYVSLYAGFLITYLFFVFFDNSILGRSLVVSLSAAAIALATAHMLFAEKKVYFSGSAVFTACVFLAFGCLQIAITLMTILLPPLVSYDEFYEVPMRSASFILPLVGSLLWSFGFIIMVNQRLNADNAEEKEKLELVFNISPDAKLITRLSDGCLVDVNTGFLAMTGHRRDEILGKRMQDIDFWGDIADRRSFIAELNEHGTVENREFPFRRKDGSGFVGIISGRVIAIKDKAHIVSVIHDISDRILAEKEIRDLLAEKELILREVHHRIKNNMNTIYSLVALQAGAMKDPASVAALDDTANRIRSMMLLYETLYESENFTDLPARDYLPPLVDEIVSNFPNAGSVTVSKEVGDFVLGVKKLQPLGIIVNELLTNIMKYAFHGRVDGKIAVRAGLVGGRVAVVVEDNGNGIPESVDFENSTGFGLKLVAALTGQLGGAIRIERGNGTRIVLEFDV